MGSDAASGAAGAAMGLRFDFTWGWTIILNVLYGAGVAWVGKEQPLQWAEADYHSNLIKT